MKTTYHPEKNPMMYVSTYGGRQPEEILQEAFKTYWKRCAWANMYSVDCCTVGRKYAYIRNGGSLLGKYDYRRKEFVDIQPWDE